MDVFDLERAWQLRLDADEDAEVNGGGDCALREGLPSAQDFVRLLCGGIDRGLSDRR